MWSLASVGVRHSFRFSQLGLLAFAVFTLGLLFLYPYYFGPRAILSVASIVIFFALLGTKWLQEHSTGKPARFRWVVTGLVCCVVISLASIVSYRIAAIDYSNDSIESDSSQEVIAFVRDRYGTDDIVHSFAPRGFHHQAGLSSVRVYDDVEVRVFQEFPEVVAYIESKKFDDVPAVREWLEERATLVFENEVYMVYEVDGFRPDS